ncbi:MULTISPECIES: hypothetical protein [unclassified Caulobacter]|uniref:hypothetical protein n=1 Tax=unclassified Caulobacter TaxID=2648921 RepID=UPI0004A71D37|nr:hypothetical protein [Caulobacter sp. UNC358MFTsu5.1]
MPKPSRAHGAAVLTALVLAASACSPTTPEDAARTAVQAAEAANSVPSEAVGGRLSPAELEGAKQGVLRGYREDATRLAIHYAMDDHAEPAERRRWLGLAAGTGSSLAILRDVYFLAHTGEPGDCVKARALVAEGKALFTREIAAAKARNLRDAKVQALTDLQDLEREIAHDACGTGGA